MLNKQGQAKLINDLQTVINAQKQKDAQEPERIVYIVFSNPGHTDKGCIQHFASFNRKEAESNCDAWHKVVPVVINVETHKNNALAKLNPLDKLILEL